MHFSVHRNRPRTTLRSPVCISVQILFLSIVLANGESAGRAIHRRTRPKTTIIHYSNTSTVDRLRSPGMWFFVGAIEIVLLFNLSEFLYPGYSVSENYISDMGVGPMPSRAVFTFAVILFGILTIIASYLLRERNPKSVIWFFMILSGIGAIGVGVFNEHSPYRLHSIFSLVAFLFGNLAAVFSYKLVSRPLAYFFSCLGLLGLTALALFGADIFLDLGPGGMERLIFYPAVIWGLGLGVYLMTTEERPQRE